MNEIDALTPKPEPETFTFENVTIYRSSAMFGVARQDCRTVTIKTGQKYAQYTDAVRVEYLEKGKRTPRAFMLDYKPWLRVVETRHAIKPDAAMVPQGDGSSVSRYTSHDPRWETDFEEKLEASGVRLLCSIGIGDREGDHLDRCRAIDPDVTK